VRVEGDAQLVSATEADAYFATRPRMSQIGFGGRYQLRITFHPHLDAGLAQAAPQEQQRDLPVFVQFAALAAVQMGVEHETALIEGLEQHGACRWTAVDIGGGHRHRRGIDFLAGLGLREQRGEGGKRFCVKIGHGSTSNSTGLGYCGAMSPVPHRFSVRRFADTLVTKALDDALCSGRTTPILAISGLQGSGKSTLAAQVVELARGRGLRAAAQSIDDTYLTRAQRQRLADRVHPLLATRGPPGTHDLPLALDTLDAASSGQPFHLPRFDKLADERVDEAQWERIDGRLDLLVFEGWFLGTPAEPEAALQTRG
jgi:hypothetical protein